MMQEKEVVIRLPEEVYNLFVGEGGMSEDEFKRLVSKVFIEWCKSELCERGLIYLDDTD